MPLLRYPYIEHDGRATMRSLADALEKLQELGHLTEGQVVRIKAAPISLPDGRRSGLVSVLGPERPDGTTPVIFMPPSARFSGRTTLGVRQGYDIQKLDDATSDSDGNVELAHGRGFLHHIALIPAPAHYGFSEIEHKIIWAAVFFLHRASLLEHQCFRPLDERLAPDLVALDYAMVAKIAIKRLKPVVQFIMSRKLEHVTEPIIRQTLRRAGIHLPRTG